VVQNVPQPVNRGLLLV